MQIIGLIILAVIVWYGFADRGSAQVINAFDGHALTMVLVGSASAVMVSSSTVTAWRTVLCLRELVPGLRFFGRTTKSMEAEREQLFALWTEGKRSQAVSLAEKSSFAAVKQMLTLILNRSPEAASAKTFLELRHEEIARWQPAISNWDMLSKLGPAFGMVGTITGMIQMFRNMSSDNLNIGSAMSLALLATLYGVAFGAGIAGPIGHYLNGLLDDRLGLLERCEKSVNEIVAATEHDPMQRRPRAHEESWLLSYADLITNLLLFFVLLLSAANLSKSKMQQITKSISGQQSPASLESIRAEIDQQIRKEQLQDYVQTTVSDEGLQLSLNSGLVFASGRAQIRPEVETILNTMLKTLQPYSKKYSFAVEGHTDSTPIVNKGPFASNWDLSSARAIVVRERLEAVGVDRGRIRVEGYAETKPLPEDQLTGLSPEERLARHRRVVVRVY